MSVVSPEADAASAVRLPPGPEPERSVELVAALPTEWHVVAPRTRHHARVMVSDAQFKAAMSHLAAGTIGITAVDRQGHPRGLLATAVFSYSTAPATMCFSVAHQSRSHDAIVGAEEIGIHLLSDRQHAVAARLASKAKDKFAGIDWSLRNGVPVLEGSLVALACRPSLVVDHLDHTLVLAEVVSAEIGEGDPLVYFRHMMTRLRTTTDGAAV